MAPFNLQRTLMRNVVIGTAIQGGWAGDLGPAEVNPAAILSDANLTEHLEIEPGAFFKYITERESDYNYAGKGFSYATESRLIAQMTSADLAGRINNWNLGWLFSLLMGSDAVTPGAGAAAGTYTHLFTWQDTGDAAACTNVYVEDTGVGVVGGDKYRMLDAAIASLTISSTAKGAMSYKATLMGTGVQVQGAMALVPGIVSRQNFYGSDTQILLGPAGGVLAALNPRVSSWEMTFNRNLAELRTPGQGLNAAFLKYGNPQCKLKLVVLDNGSGDIKSYQRNSTPLQLAFDTTSGPVGATSTFNVSYPEVVFPNCDPSTVGDDLAYTIQLDEQTILKNGASDVCDVTLINSVAAYLTASVA